MSLKQVVRYTLRRLIKAKTNEPIGDALNRHKYAYYKKRNKREYSLEELKKTLNDMNIIEGDTVLVHASWRAFVGFSASPNDVIEMLLEKVGEKGTLLMPAYGSNIEKFDVKNTPSNAGVLTEVFRKMNGVVRSFNPYFSICAKGPLAVELTKDHVNSEYGFDKCSPYHKLIQCGGKVLLLGLGRNPYKISAFHCATYQLKNELPYYKQLLNNYRTTVIIDENGNETEKIILDRIPSCQNSKRKMRGVFKAMPSESKHQRSIGYLDIILFDAKAAVQTAIDMGRKGYPVYNLKAKKELFVPFNDISNI